jgi:hypothetical protein
VIISTSVATHPGADRVSFPFVHVGFTGKSWRFSPYQQVVGKTKPKSIQPPPSKFFSVFKT